MEGHSKSREVSAGETFSSKSPHLENVKLKKICTG